ncbi:unnamed protein product [Urochloa decumbens]|uniref:Uncharacterized protein n=1 Tax=Urochloa decumbens TaxID=240449 RepID=A0ABC9DWY6_9POAL
MGDQAMEEMELDVKPPPPRQVACTDNQQLQLAEFHSLCALMEARVAAICGIYGEVIAAIDAVAAQVRELRRLRAEGLGAAELAASVRKVEWVFGSLLATARQFAVARGTAVEIGRIGIRGGGGGGAAEAADALADALQRIHIDLSQ